MFGNYRLNSTLLGNGWWNSAEPRLELSPMPRGASFWEYSLVSVSPSPLPSPPVQPTPPQFPPNIRPICQAPTLGQVCISYLHELSHSIFITAIWGRWYYTCPFLQTRKPSFREPTKPSQRVNSRSLHPGLPSPVVCTLALCLTTRLGLYCHFTALLLGTPGILQLSHHPSSLGFHLWSAHLFSSCFEARTEAKNNF